MAHIDGRTAKGDLELAADIVIVGSGPAGCAVAREAAARGARVIVVEAGPWVSPDDYPLSAFGAMSALYRDMGSSIAFGASPIPFLQGRMVGGSSPINGAICWRMPRDVHDSWCAADPALRDALAWETIEVVTDEIEARLNVGPTAASIAGRKNQLMAIGAEALGIEHRPIRRNVRDCEGLGRCMQGCPRGHKLSVDATLLADALRHDTTVLSSAEVHQICHDGRRATGIIARADAGGTVRVNARQAVILAASAIQTPALLLRSNLHHGPVGENLQCHPGVSMAGRFREPVRMWEGATQGHEAIGLRSQGLKFEALGFDLTVLAARLDGVGSDLARSIADMAHWVDWGAAIRASARGRVRIVFGRSVVTFTPTKRDIDLMRRGLRVMGEMMFAAGAEHVAPGVRGYASRVDDPGDLAELERSGPTRASAYTAAITHMFGTCRMGSDPATNVVRPDFRHHTIESLYVADSSVFPTGLGVNPQISIMALAALCARNATPNNERGIPYVSARPVDPSRLDGNGSTSAPSHHRPSLPPRPPRAGKNAVLGRRPQPAAVDEPDPVEDISQDVSP